MSEWVSTRLLADRNPNWHMILNEFLSEESWSKTLQPIVEKITNGIALDQTDGVELFNTPNLFELGRLAHLHKLAMFGNRAYFNSNVHVNQTNICVLACRILRLSKRS